MEMAAQARTELALSGLFRVWDILRTRFTDVETTEIVERLNDFVDRKLEVLDREAKSDDLVLSLSELQTAALEMEDLLDLYEYDQNKKQVSSSFPEPIPTEIPSHLRDGLNKLLEAVEGVENKMGTAQPQANTIASNTFNLRSPYSIEGNQYDALIDSLLGESHVARAAIKLALSDISRAIIMLGSNFKVGTAYKKILEQLKDVAAYHIQALIRDVNLDGRAQSKQWKDALQAAFLQLHLFDPRKYESTLKQVSSSSNPIKKIRPLFKDEFPKSPLRIGLEKLLKFIEQVEKNHPFFTSEKGTTPAKANAITPTLRVAVEKWLKFVERVEKEHPFITAKKGETHSQAYGVTKLNTVFLPSRAFFSTRSLEDVKSQQDAMEIMRNHKKSLRKITFGWTNTASSTDSHEVVLEMLEPNRNLESLSIIGYSCAKFPNWMVKENWLPSLQTLKLVSCKSLKKVPFLPTRLRKLQVENCDELMQLPFLEDTLHTLYLIDCPKLIPPLTFNKSGGLSDVRIINCSRNESPVFIDMSFLTNLKFLELAEFPKLQALSNLSPTMTALVIRECPMLTSLGNLQCCTSLKRLSIFKCPTLRREEATLVDEAVQGDIANPFPQVKRISTDDPLLILELVQQQAFSSIRSLNLTGLQGPFLHVSDDEYFHHFSSLAYLKLEDCAALPNLQKLSSLEHLYIENCPNVGSLPNLPVSLQYLSIRRCPKLNIPTHATAVSIY